jgi:nitrate/TMAO reductase-like tetraheme cytochrome c subunit
MQKRNIIKEKQKEKQKDNEKKDGQVAESVDELTKRFEKPEIFLCNNRKSRAKPRNDGNCYNCHGSGQA